MRPRRLAPLMLCASVALTLSGCVTNETSPEDPNAPLEPREPTRGEDDPPERPEPMPSEGNETNNANDANGSNSSNTSVEFRTLAQGQQSGIQEKVRLVITDPQEWSTFWEKHGSRQSPPPVEPEVDFETERVVALALGQRSNTCYAVEITNVGTDADETTVEFTEHGPGSDSVCGEAITYPHHFIAIPAHGSRVVFVE